MTDAGEATAFVEREPDATPIMLVPASEMKSYLSGLPAAAADWLNRSRLEPKAGQWRQVPGFANAPWGDRAAVLAVTSEPPGVWDLAGLPGALPPGAYVLIDPPADAIDALALGWGLGAYRFDRYRTTKPREGPLRLVWPDGCDSRAVLAMTNAVRLGRDMINAPASDMGPTDIQAETEQVAERHGADCSAIVGDALLDLRFPMIHAVGRASARAPRLIELSWGSNGPNICLVGKGVSFDSGGLDIKPASGMRLMKKDMGGGALVLALADLIMAMDLKVRLRLLIPAVENAISGSAYRPLDVLTSRSGQTVEVGDTDAEGRLILADALTLGCGAENQPPDLAVPDLVVDAATLTGAARIALGTEVPVFFCSDDDLAARLHQAGEAADDPVWRLPLVESYRRMLDSKVADIASTGDSPFGGAITAALFLKAFVPDGTPWIHLDFMAYNLSDRPGRPEGGEVMGLRALFGLIQSMAERSRHVG